jgi:phage baseplate assembly protein gpV
MLNNLSQIEQHDYSKNIFIGTVVYNEDPLELKRVKVQIPNLLVGDHSKLPWIAPMFFGLVANGGGGGSAHLVPAVGTDLVVEFQMGNPLYGLYMASPIRPDQLPAEFRDADYLWTYGWKDPAGNLFLVNTKAGSNTIKVVHGSSGAEFKIEDNGDTTYNTPGVVNIVAEGTVTITTPGEVHVDGSNVVVSGGDVIADGISLKTHVHGGVIPGGALTSVPE